MDRRSFLLSAGSLPAAPYLKRLSGLSAPEQVYIRFDNSGRLWTIGNRLVERTVCFDTQGLATRSWKHKVTGTDFMRQPFTGEPNEKYESGDEFSFQANDLKVSGHSARDRTQLQLLDSTTKAAAPEGKTLQILLRMTALPLDISVSYSVYANHPVIRKALAIRNRGSQAVVLSHMVIEDLPIRAGPPKDQVVFASYGVLPREIFFTGRAEDCLIVQKNAKTSEGMAILNEAPGWTKRTDLTGWGKGISVGYDTDIFPFERKLNPGEAFTTAGSSVAFFIQDDGFHDPHWVIPTYASEVLQKKGGGFRSPWFGNTWEPFFQNYDERDVAKVLPIAAGLGLDIFTLDTGWSNDYAENELNPEKFRAGFAGIRSQFDKNHMGLGLWAPLVVVSQESKVYKEHPEWTVHDYEGKEKTAEFPGPHDRVMCLDSPYRQVAADRLNDLIERQNAKYLKIDLTTVFNAYGEAPGCHAKGHYHDNWAQSLIGIYEGIRFVTGEIYAKHPDVLLDLTFELWGQKHIIDYGLLAAGDLDWMSNVDDQSNYSAGPLQARTLLYQRAMAIPADTMLIGNLRATTPNIEEHFATAMASAPVLLGDLRKLTPGQVHWYRTKIDWFKDLRSVVPLNQGFFTLGSWRQPNRSDWDGYARLSRAGEGVLVLFRNQCSLERAHVVLPAFPSGVFSLRSVLIDRPVRQVHGSEIMQGTDFEFENLHAVQIFEIRKAGA